MCANVAAASDNRDARAVRAALAFPDPGYPYPVNDAASPDRRVARTGPADRAIEVGARALVGTAILAAGYRAVFGSRSQAFGPFPYRGDTADRVVALTFDDGPNEPHTSTLLDVLASRSVHATFFQVGRCADRFPAVTQRVVRDGHVLANHSLDHSMRSYLTDPSQRHQIDAAQTVLHDISGRWPALYRPPWLCHPPYVLRSVRARRLQVVSGTFGSPLELIQPPARVLAAGAARRARSGSMLILHDGREARGGNRAETVTAVGPLIDRLRARGYRFTTVDQLLGVEPYLDAERAPTPVGGG
jgi:peptidoglycan/xylan/chitin deacetylase (PgdA/CDA1 family)